MRRFELFANDIILFRLCLTISLLPLPPAPFNQEGHRVPSMSALHALVLPVLSLSLTDRCSPSSNRRRDLPPATFCLTPCLTGSTMFLLAEYFPPALASFDPNTCVASSLVFRSHLPARSFDTSLPSRIPFLDPCTRQQGSTSSTAPFPPLLVLFIFCTLLRGQFAFSRPRQHSSFCRSFETLFIPFGASRN